MRLGAPNPNQLRSVQQRISLVIQTKKDLGLDVASIATVCQLLDNEGRAQELTEKGSGEAHICVWDSRMMLNSLLHLQVGSY